MKRDIEVKLRHLAILFICNNLRGNLHQKSVCPDIPSVKIQLEYDIQLFVTVFTSANLPEYNYFYRN